ncbi:MAG TPA: YgiT-type zinc finger protein [Chloroflexota bacterium]|nr:YgiT-type zinc finger protein [Chloroflexota bacterium]
MGHADPKEARVNCTITGCLGSYESRTIVHTMRRGDQIVVIDHVPAQVCSTCGDILFTPETVRRLEALGRTTAAPTGTVPLYDFSDARSA